MVRNRLPSNGLRNVLPADSIRPILPPAAPYCIDSQPLVHVVAPGPWRLRLRAKSALGSPGTSPAWVRRIPSGLSPWRAALCRRLPTRPRIARRGRCGLRQPAAVDPDAPRARAHRRFTDSPGLPTGSRHGWGNPEAPPWPDSIPVNKGFVIPSAREGSARDPAGFSGRT